MDFVAWMKALDREVIRRSGGVSVYDLADYAFMDAFKSGSKVEAVAADMLLEEGYPSDEDGDGDEGDYE